MHHAVAVERVDVPADGAEPRVRTVAQIRTLELGRQLADRLQPGDVDLGADRGDRPARYGLVPAGGGAGGASVAVTRQPRPGPAAGGATARRGFAPVADPLGVARGSPHEQPGDDPVEQQVDRAVQEPTPGSGTSNVPATAWLTAITATTPPHAALIRRLIDRNSRVCQYWRGTLSRAYCSVNGMTGSSSEDDHREDGRGKRPPVAGQECVRSRGRPATTPSPRNTTAPTTSSSLGDSPVGTPNGRSARPRRGTPARTPPRPHRGRSGGDQREHDPGDEPHEHLFHRHDTRLGPRRPQNIRHITEMPCREPGEMADVSGRRAEEASGCRRRPLRTTPRRSIPCPTRLTPPATARSPKPLRS